MVCLLPFDCFLNFDFTDYFEAKLCVHWWIKYLFSIAERTTYSNSNVHLNSIWKRELILKRVLTHHYLSTKLNYQFNFSFLRADNATIRPKKMTYLFLLNWTIKIWVNLKFFLHFSMGYSRDLFLIYAISIY